jgi:hypothetical protein
VVTVDEEPDELVVVVTVVMAGAHTSFGVFGVTSCDPNWSFARTLGNVAFRHLTL